MITSRFFILIAIVVFCNFTSVFAQNQDTISLKHIPVIGLPEISGKNLKITVNFVFDQLPSNYWLYYSKREKRIVFEFFGVHIRDSLPEFINNTILSDLVIQNSESELALNKKISKLSLTIDDGWHYESQLLGKRVIKLQLWRRLTTANKLDKNNIIPILPLLFAIGGILSGISFFYITKD